MSHAEWTCGILLLAEWARSVSPLRLLRWKVAGDFDEHQSSTAQRVGHEHSLSYVQQVDCKDGLATPRTAEILRCGFIIDVHRFALCRSAGPVIFRIPRLSDPPRWRMARRPGGPPRSGRRKARGSGTAEGATSAFGFAPPTQAAALLWLCHPVWHPKVVDV
jgi:hypothetical protein